MVALPLRCFPERRLLPLPHPQLLLLLLLVLLQALSRQLRHRQQALPPKLLLRPQERQVLHRLLVLLLLRWLPNQQGDHSWYHLQLARQLLLRHHLELNLCP
jgi:hypothetical protein